MHHVLVCSHSWRSWWRRLNNCRCITRDAYKSNFDVMSSAMPVMHYEAVCRQCCYDAESADMHCNTSHHDCCVGDSKLRLQPGKQPHHIHGFKSRIVSLGQSLGMTTKYKSLSMMSAEAISTARSTQVVKDRVHDVARHLTSK